MEKSKSQASEAQGLPMPTREEVRANVKYDLRACFAMVNFLITHPEIADMVADHIFDAATATAGIHTHEKEKQDGH